MNILHTFVYLKKSKRRKFSLKNEKEIYFILAFNFLSSQTFDKECSQSYRVNEIDGNEYKDREFPERENDGKGLGIDKGDRSKRT